MLKREAVMRRSRLMASLSAMAFMKLAAAQAPADNAASKAQVEPRPAAAAAPAPRPMDTGESIGFMGRSLWFEVRRRLNLTTEEEEKKHKAETREVKLKLGGLQVAREAAEEHKPVPQAKR